MSQFVYIETGEPGPDPIDWVDTLPHGPEKEQYAALWLEHQEKVKAAKAQDPNAEVPAAEGMFDFLLKFKEACKVRDA